MQSIVSGPWDLPNRQAGVGRLSNRCCYLISLRYAGKDISCSEGLFFITFTCYRWQALIEQTDSYDLVYGWFDYLKKQNHRIAGYVIMPNHLHVLIDFAATVKSINAIIGNGKRFMAYEIIKRLQQAGKTDVLLMLQNG